MTQAVYTATSYSRNLMCQVSAMSNDTERRYKNLCAFKLHNLADSIGMERKGGLLDQTFRFATIKGERLHFQITCCCGIFFPRSMHVHNERALYLFGIHAPYVGAAALAEHHEHGEERAVTHEVSSTQFCCNRPMRPIIQPSSNVPCKLL